MFSVSLWRPSGPDRNSFDYTTWRVLENKINATSHPNIDSLKNVYEEEWNETSEEFILMAGESFPMCVDTIIEKNGGHIG